jgi:biotin carboxyl carrier protein
MRKLMIILLFMIFLACSPKKKNETFIYPQQTFRLEEEDIARLDLTVQNLLAINESEEINIPGEIDTIMGQKYLVSVPYPGFIKEIKIKTGEQVHKGQALAILNNIDFLEQKLHYLDAAINLDFCKKNYARQGELAIEQATSLKKMELAEMQYKRAELTYLGLKEKLSILGIETSTLTQDALNDLAYLYAPVSGTVIQIHVDQGQYCTQNKVVFVLSDKDKEWFRFRISPTQYNRLQKKDSLLVIPDNGQPKMVKILSIINQDSEYTIYAVNSLQESNMKTEIISGVINLDKKRYKIPVGAVINQDYVALLHDNEIRFLKLNNIIRAKAYVLCDFFQVQEGTLIITENPEELKKYLNNEVRPA